MNNTASTEEIDKRIPQEVRLRIMKTIDDQFTTASPELADREITKEETWALMSAGTYRVHALFGREFEKAGTAFVTRQLPWPTVGYSVEFVGEGDVVFKESREFDMSSIGVGVKS